jgi:anti-sigma factor RsiW
MAEHRDLHMCDNELLVGYVYDDIEPADRRAFESHLLTCAECRGELKALKNARTQLRSWAPPEPAVEFHVVRGPVPPRRAWLRSPAWGLAAAAVLVLATASAIANVEVRYGADGLVVRTGWTKAATAAAAQAVAPAATAEDMRNALSAISARLGALESAATARPGVPAVQASAPHPAASEILRSVRQMVAESEGRQEQELALRITQVLRDVEGMRRVDLDRIQRGLAQVQGLQDTTIIRQRDLENHIYRVAQQK